MRIGIHKLGFAEHEFVKGNVFKANDKNGMFAEVNLLIQAFIGSGYSAEYVDLRKTYVKNHYDIIYVFNGFENSTSSLKNLRRICEELNYVLTDSRFYNDMLDFKNNIRVDNFFVQSEIKMFHKPTFNSKLYKLPVYECAFLNSKDDVERNGKLIFGGSVRQRKEQILEYVVRPNTDYFLRFDELGFDTRIPIMDYKKLLVKYTYGIVLINKWDTEIGNITWRYYENIANGLITFVSRDSDPYNQLLDEDDFMYVSSYSEMLEKIMVLEGDHKTYSKVLMNQVLKMHPNDFSGRTFVKSLLESREVNAR